MLEEGESFSAKDIHRLYSIADKNPDSPVSLAIMQYSIINFRELPVVAKKEVADFMQTHPGSNAAIVAHAQMALHPEVVREMAVPSLEFIGEYFKR